MSFGPREYLRHILAELDYLLEASAGLDREAYLASPTLRRAFVRALEVIGEAAKHLSTAYRDAHPEVPWRALTGMRDRLVHGYFGVDHDLVWQVVHDRISGLRREIATLVDREADDGGGSARADED